MLAGLGLSLVHRLIPHAWRWLIGTFTVTVEVREEPVFAWMGDWIHGLPNGGRCRRMSGDIEHLPRGPESNARRARLILAPGRGTHVFRHAGLWLWLERRKEAVVEEVRSRTSTTSCVA